MNHINSENPLTVGRWSNLDLHDHSDTPTFSYDDELVEQPPLSDPGSQLITVVVRAGDENRINTLLESSHCRVLIGDAAFSDAGLIDRCVARFGSERIGVWIPVQLFESNWSLDKESNADFNVIAVTNPVPRWNILDAAGEQRDMDAILCAKNMVAQGAGAVMLEVADPQDEDLTVCADMAENLGNKLWLSTNENEWDYWVRYAGVSRVVLPANDVLDMARIESAIANINHSTEYMEESA